MRNKLIATGLLGFFAFLNSPAALAVDTPILTWERGKEHNIVLGGNTNVADWKIQLVSPNQESLAFHMSKQNANGYVVYSVNIPSTYKLGIYTVETSGAGLPKKVVAGVSIVNMISYNLLQIPIKLIILLLTLVFLIATLSIMRMKKYEQIQYLRPTPSAQLPNFVASFYRLRGQSVDSLKKSLFKFLLIREGELTHKISPTLWALLPALSLLLGSLVAKSGQVVGGVAHVSVALFFLTALIGVIDPYSGFTAAIGFAFVQTIVGNVTSVSSLMSLFAVGAGWAVPGIISSLYQDMFRKDNYSSALKRVLPDIFASLMGGLIFLDSELLTNSFANHVGPISEINLLIPALVVVAIFARMHFERYILRDLHLTGENYQVRVLTLPRVVSPRTVGFAALYFIGTIYVWTRSLGFALIVGIMMAVPISLLVVRFDSPKIQYFGKLQRNILIEGLLLCGLMYLIFIQVSDMPFDVNQKGKFFILYSALVLFIHGFLSAIIDTSNREQVAA